MTYPAKLVLVKLASTFFFKAMDESQAEGPGFCYEGQAIESVSQFWRNTIRWSFNGCIWQSLGVWIRVWPMLVGDVVRLCTRQCPDDMNLAFIS